MSRFRKPVAEVSFPSDSIDGVLKSVKHYSDSAYQYICTHQDSPIPDLIAGVVAKLGPCAAAVRACPRSPFFPAELLAAVDAHRLYLIGDELSSTLDSIRLNDGDYVTFLSKVPGRLPPEVEGILRPDVCTVLDRLVAAVNEIANPNNNDNNNNNNNNSDSSVNGNHEWDAITRSEESAYEAVDRWLGLAQDALKSQSSISLKETIGSLFPLVRSRCRQCVASIRFPTTPNSLVAARRPAVAEFCDDLQAQFVRLLTRDMENELIRVEKRGGESVTRQVRLNLASSALDGVDLSSVGGGGGGSSAATAPGNRTPPPTIRTPMNTPLTSRSMRMTNSNALITNSARTPRSAARSFPVWRSPFVGLSRTATTPGTGTGSRSTAATANTPTRQRVLWSSNGGIRYGLKSPFIDDNDDGSRDGGGNSKHNNNSEESVVRRLVDQMSGGRFSLSGEQHESNNNDSINNHEMESESESPSSSSHHSSSNPAYPIYSEFDQTIAAADCYLRSFIAGGYRVSIDERIRFTPHLRTLCRHARGRLATDVVERGWIHRNLRGPVYVFGDVHGMFRDVQWIGETFWGEGVRASPASFLFLGDYVDRGFHGVEVLIFLFMHKLLAPNQVVLLRGNHEAREVESLTGKEDKLVQSMMGGDGNTALLSDPNPTPLVSRSFVTQCQSYGPDIYDLFQDCFTYLPFAAIIEDQVFCIHAGVPRCTPTIMKRILGEHWKKNLPDPCSSALIPGIPLILQSPMNNFRFSAGTDRFSYGLYELITDLTWSHVAHRRDRTDEYGFVKNEQTAVSVKYDESAVDRFLSTFFEDEMETDQDFEDNPELSCIVRGHQGVLYASMRDEMREAGESDPPRYVEGIYVTFGGKVITVHGSFYSGVAGYMLVRGKNEWELFVKNFV